MSGSTAPGDLLPGLLRPGAPVLHADGWGGIVYDSTSSAPGLDDVAVGGSRWGLGEGSGKRIPRSELALRLATPTGWDAAVACLARRCWPDMEATDRAEFCFADGAWTLFAPARLQRRKPRPLGFTPCVVWACAGGADDPVAALRAVLLHEAGRR